MAASWKRFLLIQFPAAAVALAATGQILAWSLSEVPARRNRTDELALAVLEDRTNYHTVLLADSITRNATDRFSIGRPGEIANLATNANFGMEGELLLLQRYLRVHTPPENVVLIFAPGMYHGTTAPRLVRYYLWRVFQRPEERDFLVKYQPDIGRRDWLPAIVDLQERIVEPLFSLAKQTYLGWRKSAPARIAAGSVDPDPEAKVDTATPADAAAIATAISEQSEPVPTAVNAAALRGICALSQQYGFRIRLAWPPMAAEVSSAVRSSGALADLHQQIRAMLGASCAPDEIFDFNTLRSYTTTSFHRDLIHLFGEGWEQRYASDLAHFLGGLPAAAPSQEAVRAQLVHPESVGPSRTRRQ